MEAFLGAPTVIDLMLFHTTERRLYKRLVRVCRVDAETMSTVMALWLWFESIGYHDFIRHVYSYTDDVLLLFVSEAISCLDVLHRSRGIAGCATEASVGKNYEIPATNWLLNDPIDLRFFDFNREAAATGIQTIKNKVCRIIFDDQLLLHATRDMSHSRGLFVRLFGEGSSIAIGIEKAFKKTPLVAVTLATVKSPRDDVVPPFLNSSVFKYPLRYTLTPLQANSCSPIIPPEPSSEDQRSMFVTFSKGHPITREDIADFFSMTYGPCVENVMIEKAASGHRPMYGRVVFTTPSMITIVLNGHRTAKFIIKGKHLWARMYVPRHI